MFELTDKVALVTGCGSSAPGWGNGKAIATLFARQGAHIVGVDRDTEAGSETVRVITEEGFSCRVETADVTDDASVAELVKKVIEREGRIDILVNNVGYSMPGGPAELTEAVWDEQMDVNLKSAYLTCHHVLPIMAEQGKGAVVNIASVAGLRYVGKPQVAYAAAKAGLLQFSKTTAVIYADKGVRVNCVVPGLMETPLLGALAQKYAGGDYQGFVASRHKQVPMGHMGNAWDVAHAALFLASDEASYVTATELVVDGGFTSATR
ncbi:SDR family NAD(P)-dependent oxidoreductase [Sphingobium sp. BS19]|uniref:SDR family NAD(P)-dependent oxidoreductase n=1 Tax=Sphingobium sp. BS19 TaxID=3018973 RepID=UPI0022EE2F2D|nr:SDR family NAD(P)-dependent oxidoreductase [Sphingobium sp. BS19]GLJ00503.1 dehydrogenase [Sphingobium sp. BS19]